MYSPSTLACHGPSQVPRSHQSRITTLVQDLIIYVKDISIYQFRLLYKVYLLATSHYAHGKKEAHPCQVGYNTLRHATPPYQKTLPELPNQKKNLKESCCQSGEEIRHAEPIPYPVLRRRR